MSEARRQAYLIDPDEMVADLCKRETWPLYPPMREVRIISLEVVEANGRVSFFWTAPDQET